jgi:ribosome maturation factor RimP
MSEFVTNKVRNFLETLLPTMELELFDVQFRREGHGWVLRVMIDAERGISLDDCSGVSRELGTYLDIEDCITHPYHLEVSSPGLERPLRSLGEFSRFSGKKAKVRLHSELDGRKVLEGNIVEVSGDAVAIEGVDGKAVRLTMDMISKARLVI